MNKGLNVSVPLHTTDVVVANMLRRAMYHIPTWCIGYVTFYENTSSREDEVLSLLLGLLPIHNTNLDFYDDDDNTDHRFTIREKGPKIVTSDDIDGLPFVHTHPLLVLQKGQRLHCDLILSKGSGIIHAKWNPVSCVRIEQKEEGDPCRLLFKTKTMLSAQKLMELTYKYQKDAENAKPLDIFSKQLVHENEDSNDDEYW